MKHDGTIVSPVGSGLCCGQLPLSPPVPPLSCSAPHCLSLSLSLTRFDALKDVIVLNVLNYSPSSRKQACKLITQYVAGWWWSGTSGLVAYRC